MTRFLLMTAFVCAALLPLVGCTVGSIPPTPPPASSEPSTHPAPKRPPLNLAWETDHSERVPWSETLLAAVDSAWPKLSQAADFDRVCPKFKSLSKEDQKFAVASLFVFMAKFESNWNPLTTYTETEMNIDPITGVRVESEGLFQLSYQDESWAKCGFDWSKDKALSKHDPKKTILSPDRNIRCAVSIMARHASGKFKEVFLMSPYWSVIRDGDSFVKVGKDWKAVQGTKQKSTRFPEIRDLMLKNLPFC